MSGRCDSLVPSGTVLTTGAGPGVTAIDDALKRVSNLEDRENNRLVRERTAFYSVKRRAASLIENGRECGAARVQNALPAATPLMSTTVNE